MFEEVQNRKKKSSLFKIFICQSKRDGMHAQSLSHVRLFGTQQTVAYQAPLSMESPRQEYWSRLPFPPPGNLPNLGINLESPVSSALQAGSLLLSHWEAKRDKISFLNIWDFVESVNTSRFSF